jgi:hypothetical protein
MPTTKPLPPIRSDISDKDLTAAVALACGIAITPGREEVDIDSRTIYQYPAHHKPYATSLDAVLPLVAGFWHLYRGTCVVCDIDERFVGKAETAARAVCFALYIAHDGSVEEVRWLDEAAQRQGCGQYAASPLLTERQP